MAPLNLMKVLDDLYSHATIEPTIIKYDDGAPPMGSEAIENKTIGSNTMKDRTMGSNAMKELSAADADDDYMSDTIVVQPLPPEKRR
jgi:hypothetical protein